MFHDRPASTVPATLTENKRLLPKVTKRFLAVQVGIRALLSIWLVLAIQEPWRRRLATCRILRCSFAVLALWWHVMWRSLVLTLTATGCIYLVGLSCSRVKHSVAVLTLRCQSESVWRTEHNLLPWWPSLTLHKKLILAGFMPHRKPVTSRRTLFSDLFFSLFLHLPPE